MTEKFNINYQHDFDKMEMVELFNLTSSLRSVHYLDDVSNRKKVIVWELDCMLSWKHIQGLNSIGKIRFWNRRQLLIEWIKKYAR